MKKNQLPIILLILISICSCSSKKNIIYFQDFNEHEIFEPTIDAYKIKHGDFLKITILTQNTDNLLISNQNTDYSMSRNRENLIFDSYLVSDVGDILFPDIGKINVLGLTASKVSKLISTELSSLQILTNPVVDVKVINMSFTIIGEVNKPGKYFYDEPDLNIIEAIGLAGDLTINGKRNNIKLLRNNGKEYDTYSFDLTSSNIFDKKYFQINSGDIIIVDPNTNRVKNAGIIGNSGTLLSLLSFILSSIIITTR